MLSKSDIRSAQTYQVDGRSFATEYAAQRYVAEQNLISVLVAVGISVPTTNSPQISLTASPYARARHREDATENTTQLREWLTEHVHELLPVLQAIAEANPKNTSVEVEEPE